MRTILALCLVAAASAEDCGIFPGKDSSSCTCNLIFPCKYRSGTKYLCTTTENWKNSMTNNTAVTEVSGCTEECPDKLTQEDEDDFGASIMGGVWAGNAFCIILLSLASAVICCGKMVPQAKIIGALSILMGIINMAVPFIASSSSASAAVEGTCERMKKKDGTECNDDCKAAVKALYSLLGFLFAYTAALGWLNIILGITAIAIGGAACCKCCKAKGDATTTPQVVVVSEAPKQ